MTGSRMNPLHKEPSRRGPSYGSAGALQRTGKTLGLSLWTGPCATRGGRVHREPRAQDGVNSDSPPARAVKPLRRHRTWTHNLSRGGRDGAHAVEFSKTVAPLRRGGSSPNVRARTTEKKRRARGGLTSIAPDPRAGERCGGEAPGLSRFQLTTWTSTVRCRGRSSKSIKTTCCHVPSASRRSTKGIVSEGPITAARKCAWAFVSWLRRLWS